MTNGALLVLGSANRDYTVVIERHPMPGETVLGGEAVVGTGGKGSNQAVAAARAGAKPIFLAAVGADSTGADILRDLDSFGVDTSRVERVAHATGIALITVSHSGENSIVVAAGANQALEAAPIASVVSELAGPGVVLLAQLEIPVAVVDAAASVISAAGGRFVLNLSPFTTVPPRMLALADPLVVNETEASELSNSIIDSIADAQVVAGRLLERSRSVVLTLGGDGTVIADSSGVVHLHARRVEVIDTTGAGDAFAGALAAALAAGATLRDAVEKGLDAGAEAVQHLGAQPSL
jgi:ribokinase